MSGGLQHFIRWALLPVASATMASCAAAPPSSMGPDIRVVEVSPPVYHGTTGQPLETACRNWTLSAQQVETFFRLSTEYPEAPYQRFYQVPCGVDGRLELNERRWHFSINAGGMATWTDGSTTRHFGCSTSRCDELLLLPSDDMEPD